MQIAQEYLYKEGTTPQTRTVIASRLKIYSFAYGLQNFQQIAVIASMSQTHGRSADPVRGVGFGDQIAEIVPGVSDPITLSFTRAAIWTASLQQVFGYAGGIDGLVRSLKHHRWPFDIKQEAVISQLEQAIAQRGTGRLQTVDHNLRAIITRYIGCWMTSLTMDFASDTSIVSESGDVTCTDITDDYSDYNEIIATGNSPGTASGESADANASIVEAQKTT